MIFARYISCLNLDTLSDLDIPNDLREKIWISNL